MPACALVFRRSSVARGTCLAGICFSLGAADHRNADRDAARVPQYNSVRCGGREGMDRTDRHKSPVVPRVVIVGAGCGGLEAARGLDAAPAHVTVIDRNNHHLFQPLLYEVATSVLSPADISTPIRGVLRHQRNAQVLMADVTGIDTERRHVLMGKRSCPYDYLVLALGSGHSYFGHDEWARFAPGLKTISDATLIRREILTAFEAAEMEPDPEQRNALLTFVIVGGGPTGVELAGAIAELARKALVSDFRHINPAAAHVVLVEAMERILPAFPERLARK